MHGITVLKPNTADGGLTFLAQLRHAPFPFDGECDETGRPFFDSVDRVTGARLHTTTDGKRYGEAAHYASDQVLFHVPPRFDPALPCRLLVYFHGHLSELRRNVIEEMALTDQVSASGTNTVLVAPQLATNALDSSPGKLVDPGGLGLFLDEAASVLALATGLPTPTFADAPVVLAAFSGGYRAAALGLERGGVARRLEGVLLFDAVFGEVDRFAAWVSGRWEWGFFVALYSPSSEAETRDLIAQISRYGIRHRSVFPERFAPGTIAFVPVLTDHHDVPKAGPPAWPVAEALKRMRSAR